MTSRGRRWLNWLNVAVMVFLMAAFLVGVNLISHARFARIDMTTDRVWDISPQARQILKGLKSDLEIYINAVASGPMAQDKSLPEAWRRTQLLLFEMASQNSKIKVLPIIEGSQAQAKVLNQFSGLEPNMLYFLYRASEEKPVTRAVSVTDFYTGNPVNGELTDYFGESRIVTTISQLISDRKLKVYHTVGHREPEPNSSQQRGLSVLSNRLTTLENAEFKPLDLARDKFVPDDADLVFIAAPMVDFTTVETEALTKYWQAGGRLFVATYPLIPNELAEFRKWMETCGILLNRDIVLDAQRELGDAAQLVIRDFTRHPVNLNMQGVPFRAGLTASVSSQPVNKRMQAMPLFLSSNQTWAEQDMPPRPGSKHGPGEQWGPVPIAAASEELGASGKTSRLIAWGGVSALTNEYNLMGAQPNDQTLGYILNNFRWLVEREVIIPVGMEARKTRMKPFAPPPGGNAVIAWISIAGIPLLGIALGGLAWYFRRK